MKEGQRKTWLSEAESLLAGAQRAQAAGDEIAFIALMRGAAQCLEMAKMMEAEIKRATGIDRITP